MLFPGLSVPTATPVKLRLGGLSTRVPGPQVGLGGGRSFPPASARLGAARLIAKRSATKFKTENKKIDDFGRDMINPPENSAVIVRP
jgi:hypothetical protein